ARPNFVWITSEDNSASWLPSYGHPLAETPTLDGLVAEGFRYTNCFANAPVCAPQRSTWLTGMYSLSLGTHHMRSRNRIPLDKVPLYPLLLKQAGYFCTNQGKTDYNASGLPIDLWDIASKDERSLWRKRPEGKPFFAVVNNGMTHEGSTLKRQEIETDPAVVEIKPYHPDTPVTRHYYAQYIDSQRRMDNKMNDVVERLKEDGLFEDTIIIYCSDHGGALPRGKRDMRDTGLHCPLVVRIPEKFKHLWPNVDRGTTVERLVSFIDMPKTWLAMAGADIPEAMQGRIFLGPKTEPEPEYHYAFMSRYDARLDNSRAIRDKRFLYIRHYMPYAIYGGCVEYRARGEFYREWL
ncbi:MAG: sulfatase, partial [Planctomycetes bacterium]|nr:sulfatase [Planctomycetota bacterium]